MVNLQLVQTNFTAGQISNKLLARTDISKYYSALNKLENFMVMPQGGLEKRPGTKFVAEVKYSNRKTRLIPFQFSTTQSYILEFGHLYLRIYKDLGQVISMGVPYEIASPYSENDLVDLTITQSADILYICHQNFVTRKLSRTGHTAWSFSNLITKDGPYLDQNTTSTTFQPSNTTGNITITSSTAYFHTTDVGRQVRILQGALWGYAEITSYVSSTVVNATVLSNFSNTTAVTTWQISAWSQTNGYPSTISFFQERLAFGGNMSQPQTLWLSNSGDFENFAPTEKDTTIVSSNAITFTLADDQVNAIRWISASRKVLSIGTTDSEYTLQGSGNNDALSPSSVQVSRESSFGSKKIKPARIGNIVLFTQRAGKKVIEYNYDFSNDGYIGSDITILSDDITNTGIVELAYVQEPTGIIYFCLADGSLISLTYQQEQKVYAWAKHILGGTNVKVKSVASISSSDEKTNELWLIVERTINGVTKQYVEVLTNNFTNTNETKEEYFFLDSGLLYAGPSTTTISGLNHLEGETVGLCVDGANHPDKTVVDGKVSLDYNATNVVVGLKYVSEIITIPYDYVQGNNGQTLSTKKIYEVGLRLYKSLGGKIGLKTGKQYDMLFRSTFDKMNQTPGVFTGLFTQSIDSVFEKDLQIRITHSDPLPFNLLGIATELDVT